MTKSSLVSLSLLHGHALPQVSEMIDLLPDKHFALGPICQPAGEGCPILTPSITPSCAPDTPVLLYPHFSFSAQCKWRYSLNCSRLGACEGLKCYSCREVQGSFQSQSQGFHFVPRAAVQTPTGSTTLRVGFCTPLGTSSAMETKHRYLLCPGPRSLLRQIALLMTLTCWFNRTQPEKFPVHFSASHSFLPSFFPNLY